MTTEQTGKPKTPKAVGVLHMGTGGQTLEPRAIWYTPARFGTMKAAQAQYASDNAAYFNHLNGISKTTTRKASEPVSLANYPLGFVRLGKGRASTMEAQARKALDRAIEVAAFTLTITDAQWAELVARADAETAGKTATA